MSKDKDRAVSMRKVIRFVNQYPNDWIQQVYGDEPYLAKHLQSKWEALGKDKSTTSYEAIMQLMTALDYENEIKLMEWIDKKFEKGGKVGHSRFKEGITVRVDEAYLKDEASGGNATPTAVVMSEPSDDEELVMIRYEDGSIDYLGQEWLEPIKSSGGSMASGGGVGENKISKSQIIELLKSVGLENKKDYVLAEKWADGYIVKIFGGEQGARKQVESFQDKIKETNLELYGIGVGYDYNLRASTYLIHPKEESGSTMASGGGVKAVKEKMFEVGDMVIMEHPTGHHSEATKGQMGVVKKIKQSELSAIKGRWVLTFGGDPTEYLQERFKKAMASGGGVRSLKIEFKRLDPNGNINVDYDDEKEKWFWEDYRKDTYRDGFKTEREVYKDAIEYLEENSRKEPTIKKYDQLSRTMFKKSFSELNDKQKESVKSYFKSSGGSMASGGGVDEFGGFSIGDRVAVKEKSIIGIGEVVYPKTDIGTIVDIPVSKAEGHFIVVEFDKTNKGEKIRGGFKPSELEKYSTMASGGGVGEKKISIDKIISILNNLDGNGIVFEDEKEVRKELNNYSPEKLKRYSKETPMNEDEYKTTMLNFLNHLDGRGIVVEDDDLIVDSLFSGSMASGGGVGIKNKRNRVMDYFIQNDDDADLLEKMGYKEEGKERGMKLLKDRNKNYDAIFQRLSDGYDDNDIATYFDDLGLEELSSGGSIMASGGGVKKKVGNGIDFQSDFTKEDKATIESDIKYHVADMVKSGITSGDLSGNLGEGEPAPYRGWWEVEIQEDENDEDTRNEEVARKISDGYTLGYNPTFTFGANVWSEKSSGGSMASGGGVGEVKREKVTESSIKSKKHPITFTYDDAFRKGNIVVQRVGGSDMWNVGIDGEPMGRVLGAQLVETAIKKASKEFGSTMAKGGKTREVKVYQFEELSKDAQKKALDSFRHINVDFDDWSYPVLKEDEGWEDKLKKQGWGEVEISFSGFWSQGDGASFVTKHIDVEKLMKHYGLDKKYPLAFEHADQLSGYVNRDTHHYVHEKSTSVSINTDDMSSDEYDALKDKKKFDDEVASVEDDLEQIKVKLSREIYRDLEKYYESLTSDESVKDTIEANEYEFLEDGRLPNFEKGGKAGGSFWDYYAGHSGLVYGNYLSSAEKKGIGGVLLGVGLGIAVTLGYRAGKKHNISIPPQTESDVKAKIDEISETELKRKELKNLPSKIRFYDNFPKGVEHKGTNYRVYEKYEDGKWSKISNDQFDDLHLMKDKKGELIYERKKKSEQGKFVFL